MLAWKFTIFQQKIGATISELSIILCTFHCNSNPHYYLFLLHIFVIAFALCHLSISPVFLCGMSISIFLKLGPVRLNFMINYNHNNCATKGSTVVWNQCDQKKSPNVYKSCPRMISLEKWYILTTLQKLPKKVEDLGKLIGAKGFKKLPKSPINRPIWSHCLKHAFCI